MIEKIEILGEQNRHYVVGDSINGRVVGYISQSADENNFAILDTYRKLLFRIINCPVIISYDGTVTLI